MYMQYIEHIYIYIYIYAQATLQQDDYHNFLFSMPRQYCLVAVLDPSRGFRTGECQVAFDDLRPVPGKRRGTGCKHGNK